VSHSDFRSQLSLTYNVTRAVNAKVDRKIVTGDLLALRWPQLGCRR
jgi:hypothetical protein